MGARQVKPRINQAEYEGKFRSVAQDCQAGPVEDRSCKDMCCLVTFIIMTLIFVGVGIYFIANIDSGDIDRIKDSFANSTTTSNSSSSQNSTSNKTSAHKISTFDTYQDHMQVSNASGVAAMNEFPNLLQAAPYIILMSVFALVLSLVIVIAISKVPKVIIYGLIVFTFLLIAAGIIGGLVMGVMELAIVCGIFGLIWGILVAVMFCCFKEQFDAAIVLLKVTGRFLKEKPSVLLAPLIVMFMSYFYFIFWLISFIAIQLDRTTFVQTTSSSQTPAYTPDYHDYISMFWLFLNIFYSYFLYYVMVFLIATATAVWYFGSDEGYLKKGFSNIWNAHIGSLTFASMIVTIIECLKSSTDNDNRENNIASCCVCILRCCFAFIEEIIKVMNHNAIIVMSVTGEDFIDSAKSAIYLIYNNFGLFVAVEMVEFLLKVCVLFLTILLPTGLGIVLLKLTYNQAPSEEEIYIVCSALIIIIICLLISLLSITVLSQALSCVFIFYCLDERFRTFNYGAVNRVPGDLRGLFNEIQHEGKSVQAENFYRTSQQFNY